MQIAVLSFHLLFWHDGHVYNTCPKLIFYKENKLLLAEFIYLDVGLQDDA